ncbi:hypothetical protein KR222_001717, partial [Zaprionus bogoriensis]
IPYCILQSIQDSKCVIILMTKEFIDSPWSRFEFRNAIKSTSEDKQKRVIVILYPDVPLDELDSELRIYMKFHNYLERNDPDFWEKLIMAMP